MTIEAAEVSGERPVAEQLYRLVDGAIDRLEHTPTAGKLTSAELLADAQLTTLQAIYHELRHGHDQASRQTAVMAAHTLALNEHADAMDKLSNALLNHADTISRYPGDQ